jgi:thymidine kinase
MPKLYFRYGTMSSAKSANAIMVAHTYSSQGKYAAILKSSVDTRDNAGHVVSRAGLSCPVDLVVCPGTGIDREAIKAADCIIVDEAQFLDPEQIEELREMSMDVPVICYGLRTDYRTRLFPASARLMEIADVIEEVKTTCQLCDKKAVINAKVQNGRIVRDGSDAVQVGGNELYQPLCWKCWDTHI